MLFVLIIALFIAFSYEPPSDGDAVTGPALAAGETVVAIAGVWLLAEMIALLTTWRLRRKPGDRGPIMRGYQRLRWAHAVVLLGSYAGVIYGLDWPAVVRGTWGLDQWVLIDDLLVLLPFLAPLVLSWLAYYRVEVCMRRLLGTAAPRWRSRWSHVDFLVRFQLGIVLVPLVLLLLVDDLVGTAFRGSELRQIAKMVASVLSFVLLLTCAPLLLRLLWRAEPLAPGPVRARLERLSRRLGFRSSGILVWKTDGAVVNAAVAGIVPWLRYVMLSDGLVQHLTEEEIEAVFGHEVGHIRHHHLWFYVAFLLGSSLFLLVALTTTSRVLADLLGEPTMHDAMSLAHGLAAPLAGMALYFGVFFGFLSRRFERQADVFGCRAVSCGRLDCSGDHALDAGASGAGHDGVGPGLLTAPSPQPPPPEARGGSSTPQASREGAASGALALCPVGIRTFVSALEKVSALNGSTRDTRSWRHFSIAKRVEFLERLTVQPDLEPRFQRVVLALKMLVLAALLASGWWAWGHGQELAREFIGAS